MSTDFYLWLIVAAGNAAIGIYVLVKNPKSMVHWIFFTFVMGIVGWSVGIALLMATQQFGYVAPTLWSGEVVVLALVFLSERFPQEREHRIARVRLLVPWITLALLTPTHWFIASFSLNVHGYLEPRNGPLFPLFAATIAAYIALAFYYFADSWRNSRGIRRIQLRYLFVGVGSFVGLSFLFDVLLPALGIFSFNLIGPLCSILFVGFTAYAIVRYQLLDIIVKRSVTYGATLLSVAVLFFCFEFIVEKFFSNDEVVDIIAAMFGAFAFTKVRDFFEKLTDRIFFRADYDYGEAVRDLGPILNETIALQELLVSIDAFLMRTIKPSNIMFFIVDTKQWFAASALIPLGYDASFGELVSAIREMIIFQENHDPLPAQANIARAARDHGIAAMVPLASGSGRTAVVMVLGEKRSGDILRPKDIGLLSVIAHQGGMAVENARLYETIRRHNEELEIVVAERTQEIKNLYRAQEAFVADISHQLQTPIAILEGNLELAERQPAEYGKRSLGIMRGTLDDMARLVTNILEVAKLNFSKNAFYSVAFDVGTLVEESYHDCLVLAETKGVAFVRSTQPMIVVGDRKKMKEVLLNLLSNALKHTDVDGTIAMTACIRDDTAEITVRDTGSGISPENLAHIFERFYRIPGAEARGTGLGLNICREIVAHHGGTIHAESVVGRGSIFMIRLPLASKPDVVASGILKK